MIRHQEITAYITAHPEASDRTIAKRFGVSRIEAAAFRAGLPRKPASPWQRRFETLLAGRRPYITLFCLALGIRLIALFFFRAHPETTVPILDAAYYISWAKEILAQGIIGTRPFFTEPLYAYLLALLIKLSTHGTSIMIGLQMLAGAALPAVIMKIGETIFDKKTGWLAGLFVALYAPFIFYEQVLLKTAFETFLLPAFFLVFLIALQKNTRKHSAVAGLMLGLLALIKGNSLIFIPIALIALLWNPLAITSVRQKISLALLFIAGFFLVLSPVILRNLAVSHSFMLTNYSLGMNLYQGNFWGSDGALLQPSFIRPDPKFEETDSSRMAMAYAGGRLTPNEISNFWIGKTFEEIGAHPKDWLALTGNKLLLLVNQRELGDNYVYDFTAGRIPLLRFLPNFWLLVPFGLAGLLFAFFLPLHPDEKRSRRFLLLLLVSFIASYAFTIILFHTNARYRMPVLPLILLFSAVGIRFLIAKIASKEAALAIFSGVFCLGMFALTNTHIRNFDAISAADPYNNLGVEALDRHDFTAARPFFEAGRKQDPNNLISWRNIFLLSLRDNDRDAAQRALLQELKIRPDDGGVYADLKLFQETAPLSAEETMAQVDDRLDKDASTAEADRYDPDFYEGWKLFREKKYEEASRHLLLSSAKFDNPEETLLLLALAKKNILMARSASQDASQNGQPQQQTIQQGASQPATQPGSQADTKEIEDLLRSIIGKNRSFLPAQYQLGLFYAQQKKYAEAEKYFAGIHAITDEYLDNWYYYALSAAYAKDFSTAQPLMRAFVDRYGNDASRRTQVEKFRSILDASVRKP